MSMVNLVTCLFYSFEALNNAFQSLILTHQRRWYHVGPWSSDLYKVETLLMPFIFAYEMKRVNMEWYTWQECYEWLLRLSLSSQWLHQIGRLHPSISLWFLNMQTGTKRGSQKIDLNSLIHPCTTLFHEIKPRHFLRLSLSSGWLHQIADSIHFKCADQYTERQLEK